MTAELLDDAVESAAPTWLDELRPALRRLDERIERAMAARCAEPASGIPVGLELCSASGLIAEDELTPALGWLAQTYGLASFDLDLLLVALAPEIDLHYEVVYAALQGDPRRGRPGVGLALDLLCDSDLERVAGGERLGSDAPLLAHGLLRRLPDPSEPSRAAPADVLVVDEQVVGLLTAQTGLAQRLVGCCSLLPAGPWPRWLPAGDPRRRALTALLGPRPRTAGGHCFVLTGPPGSGKHAIAAAVAGEAGALLLRLDVEQALELGESLADTARRACRAARFRGAILYVVGLEAARAAARPAAFRDLLAVLAEHPGRVILATEHPWQRSEADPSGLTIVTVGMPELAGRQACWESELAAAGLAVAREDVEALASRYRLTAGQIRAAVATAQASARWATAGARERNGRGPADSGDVAIEDLFAAARAHSSHGLALIARRIEPRYGWDDIILPPDQQAQLREIVGAVSLRHVVQERWGFGRRLSGGKGLNVLFAGPSGTGKTMAAEVIAAALALDLYAIDLSRVVSKYIGETEKNLDRIFVEAESSNAILFFDEADALFGKRSEVKDAHDRYANIETGYLLQKMEEYEGVAVLATNLRANLDEAFARRMHAVVEFPFPDEQLRARIWQVVFPREAPLGPDVDADQLARSFKLSGGNIRNVALTAAYLAAEEGPPITMRHLVRAARREYQKLGRAWEEPGIGQRTPFGGGR